MASPHGEYSAPGCTCGIRCFGSLRLGNPEDATVDTNVEAMDGTAVDATVEAMDGVTVDGAGEVVAEGIVDAALIGTVESLSAMTGVMRKNGQRNFKRRRGNNAGYEHVRKM
jgi:hypothetical protein